MIPVMQYDKYAIFDQLMEGAQVINPQWEYVYVNDTVSTHGKIPKSQLLGNTMMNVYPGIEKTELYTHIWTCLRFKTRHQMVNEFAFPDGTKGYFELRIQPVEEGVLILSFDVTKQKETEFFIQRTNVSLEEEVQKQQCELRALFDSAAVAIIGTDLYGTITHFNKGAEILLGYTSDEMIQSSIPFVLDLKEETIKNGEELSKHYGKGIKSGDFFVELAQKKLFKARECTYIRKNGTTLPVSLAVTTILDTGKNGVGYFGIATDSSELKKTKSDLEVLANRLQHP